MPHPLTPRDPIVRHPLASLPHPSYITNNPSTHPAKSQPFSLTQTRQATLLNSFTSALTTGCYCYEYRQRRRMTTNRPHALDALHHLDDMLAWVHRAIAAENEFPEALLSIVTDARMPNPVRAPTHAEDQ